MESLRAMLWTVLMIDAKTEGYRRRNRAKLIMNHNPVSLNDEPMLRMMLSMCVLVVALAVVKPIHPFATLRQSLDDVFDLLLQILAVAFYGATY